MMSFVIACLTVGIKKPLLITTLNVMCASFLRIHLYLTRESSLIDLGNLPQESRVTRTDTISRVKRVIYHGQSVPCNRTLCMCRRLGKGFRGAHSSISLSYWLCD